MAKFKNSNPYTTIAQEATHREAVAASTAAYLDALEDQRSSWESTDDFLEDRRQGITGRRLRAYQKAAESGNPW